MGPTPVQPAVLIEERAMNRENPGSMKNINANTLEYRYNQQNMGIYCIQ